MSLRPAQELVQESSKFSLRQFFESQAAPAIRSPAELPTEGFPTLNPQPDPVSVPLLPLPQPQHSPPSAFVAPHLRPQTPVEGRPPIGAPPPKDGKFTFTGLMPVTTPIQMQHKILQQHQQQALSQAATSAKPTGLHSDGGNDVMRLKAHVVSLNERLAQMSANLASTSESVIRGNKALTTERAQFHAKYASLAKKLDAARATLAEVEAMPREDVKNAKLLNAKVLELQEENEKLVAARAQLEASLAKAEAAVVANNSAPSIGDDVVVDGNDKPDIGSELSDLKGKFISLSAQHSSLLDKHAELEREIEEKDARLEAVEAEVGEANERAETWELEAVELKEKADASQLEIAHTDSLIDTLDEKLAAARTEGGVVVSTDVAFTMSYTDMVKLQKQIRQYIKENMRAFNFGPRPAPGDRVFENDLGRLGTVVDGGKQKGGAFHPAVVYDDAPGVENDDHGESHFYVVKPDAELPPSPWATRQSEHEIVLDSLTGACCPATMRCEEMERAAEEARVKTHGASEHECAQLHEEWHFLDSLARRARHALTTNEPESERVMVAHVYTSNNASEAPIDLASHVGTNPLPMGKPIDDSCLRCTTVDTDAAAERDTTTAEGRTNAFVQAVSKDLKFSMDGSQALYASSAATGVALRV